LSIKFLGLFFGLGTQKALIISVTFTLVILEMEVSRTICPGWPPMMILPISASQVVRIAGARHWPLAVFYIGTQPHPFIYISSMNAFPYNSKV
jgi:hypothetical protein